MSRQYIHWLANLQLAQFHCSLGACSSALQTPFSPNLRAWHSPPALTPGKSGMGKDTSLAKVEQAGAQLMHKLPAAVWLPEFPCVLLHHTQHKSAEIYSSQNTEVAPSVFCKTVWGAGVAWLCCLHRGLEHLSCNCAWERAQGDQHKVSQSWTDLPTSKVLCTALAWKTKLLLFWILE